MQVRLTFVAAAVAIALVGAGCQEAAKPRPAEGPSPFLAGFSLARVVASFEAAANGVHCLETQPSSMALTTKARDSAFGGWTHAELATRCDDPGDGTALAQAWARGIDGELKGSGATDLGGGRSTTAAGTFRDTWEYESRGLRGFITVQVLPAPDGRYWSIVRIFEPS
jgi:hypothetical protein